MNQQKVRRMRNGFQTESGEGVLSLEAITEDIVHVVFAPPSGPPAKPSLFVDPKPCDGAAVVEEDARQLRLRTARMVVSVEKPAGRIECFRADDSRPLVREPRKGARILRPHTVQGYGCHEATQAFEIAKGERLFGTGQQQDGALDYTGRYACLCQFNTVSAVPILLSTRGYGILWNNASFTEVNPQRRVVPLSFDKFSKTHHGKLTARETGEHAFVFEKLNRNTGRELVELRIGGRVVLSKDHGWHTGCYSGTLELQKGRTYDVFLNGCGRVSVQTPAMRRFTRFRSEVAEQIDYYLLRGDTLDELVSCYRRLTGRAPLFPKWCYGFWQSKERYKTGRELVNTVREYRRRKHPIDGIVQDWHYWGDYGWNAMKIHPEYSRDLRRDLAALHRMNAHAMFVVWPNFENRPGNDAYREFSRRGYLMSDSKALAALGNYISSYQGMRSNYYDAFHPGARDLLWKHMKKGLFDKGVDAWWLDATEPNLGSVHGIFHKYATSRGPAARDLNAYPLMHSKGIYENQRRETSEKRVILLSRTGFAGIQKYATVVWSGDTVWSWECFRDQVANGLSYSLSGLPYWTCDIGGFALVDNRSEADREGYVRWFAYGAFCPIFRAHGTSCPREVWQFGPRAERIMHKFLVLRYRLMPYIYSLAYAVTFHDDTMMRPLVMDFPSDDKAAGSTGSFLFGRSLLVSPVTRPGVKTWEVYLPRGAAWYDFWTGKQHRGGDTVRAAAGLDTLPLFVKGGSILPIGPEIQYAGQPSDAPVDLVVYPGADASFLLYEDSGDGYGYEQGDHALIRIEWRDKDRTLCLHERAGSFPGMKARRAFRVRVADGRGPAPRAGKTLDYAGGRVEVKCRA